MFFKRKNRAAAPVPPQPPGGVPAKYDEALGLAVVRFYSAASLCFDKLRIEAMAGEGTAMPPVRHLTESIACGVAIDIGPSYQRVTQKDLDDWGISFDEMLTRVARLRCGAGIETVSVGGMAMVRDETGGPCLWLCPAAAESLVGGRPIMVGQSRTCTLLAREDDSAALLLMAEYCRSGLDGEEWTESVTPTRWTGARWESTTWEQLGVPAELGKAINLRHDAANYGRMRPALKQWCSAREEAPITAAFQAYAKDGREISVAASIVDPDTEDNVIPKADRVTFAFTDDMSTLALAWEVVAERCELTPLGLTPEWYRVGSVPAREELDLLTVDR